MSWDAEDRCPLCHRHKDWGCSFHCPERKPPADWGENNRNYQRWADEQKRFYADGLQPGEVRTAA